MLEAFITSAVAFISTNIDDILILTFIFAVGQNIKTSKIILGKYIGMGILTTVSLLSAFGLKFIDEKYLFLLGIVPIILGIKEMISNIKNKEDNEKPMGSGGIINTACISIASGADNIGVYIPLFTGFDFNETIVSLLIFAVMTFIWCLLGKFIAALPKMQEWLNKYKAFIVPAVYIAIGVYIMVF